MPPIFKKKYLYDSVVKSFDYAKEEYGISSLPKQGIIIYPYEFGILKEVLEKFKFTFKKNKKFISVENKLAIGISSTSAPNAAACVDEMAALGCESVINIGVAGSLSLETKIGDIVLCDKALRDEGVSYHYIKPNKFAYPSLDLNSYIKRIFYKNDVKFKEASSWTTDAPYRETNAEIKKYFKEGILTVEMEASAVFSVADYYKVKSASVFVISDIVCENKWDRNFNSKKVKDSLYNIFSVILKGYSV
ncbi:MAG TPA: nucleoside phosphorylase [Elusimicrobiales bacterium]|nr:nucleoside phosphorylase [Elusimicrobiales bacterium]